MRYRSKPVEIDAVPWYGALAGLPGEWIATGKFEHRPGTGEVVISTLEGPARAEAGEHYIVRGTVGEFYPVRRDIFEAKYEAVA
jgi:hypothetical protein